jgi:hypothetical protein
MNVITVKRTKVRRGRAQESAVRRSLRDLARGYFASERSLEFAVEALLFAIIVAISAWPISVTLNALSEFLQRTPS